MPRLPRIPQLSLHKASGKAVVRLNGRDHYLGVFGSPEAKSAYDRLIAEWLANDLSPNLCPILLRHSASLVQSLVFFWEPRQPGKGTRFSPLGINLRLGAAN